jgi:O-antigen/teichoic acid export membrane protein
LSLKKNVIANYVGQGWSALMGIAFVPLYIRYLGMEAYGLVGFFAVIQVWLGLLDAGMSPALNRELARYVAGAKDIASTRNLLRTLEVIAVGVGLAVVLGVSLSANWIATQWVKLEQLPIDEVSDAVMIMSWAIGARWIASLYRSALTGLQKQVSLNVLLIVSSTVKGLGVLGVLEWISPSVLGFFVFQAIVALVELLVLGWMIHTYLPLSTRPIRFDIGELRTIWHFALGVTAISFLSLLLTQIDKVLLSSLLPLQEFGFYSLAASVAGILGMISGILPTVYFPKFSELLARKDDVELVRVFHQGAQIICLTLLPASVFLAFFSRELLSFWLADPDIVQAVAPIVSIMSLGTLLNGFMVMPYFMQMAYGETRLTIWANTIAATILVPAILVVVPLWGGVGAATCWLLLNLCYVTLLSKYIFRGMLPGEKKRWYLEDMIYPGLIVLVVAGVLKSIVLTLPELPSLLNFIQTLIFGGLVALASLFSTSLGRSFLKGLFTLAGKMK